MAVVFLTTEMQREFERHEMPAGRTCVGGCPSSRRVVEDVLRRPDRWRDKPTWLPGEQNDQETETQ